MSELLVEFAAVTKVYRTRKGRVPALDQVSFTLEAGEVFGLLGANGAGKTTALRCLLGLSRIDSGRLTVFGRERPDRRALFTQTAFLPEEPRLFTGASGREHLLFFGRLCGLRGKELRQRVDETLALVGLAEARDRRIAGYSKGMKQRLGLAGAILHRPRLLILDEPTRGLDPIAQHETRELFQQLAAQGVTLFLSSHLLGEVEKLCTRVAILDRGQVKAVGQLTELLKAGAGQEIRFRWPAEAGQPPAGASRTADGGWTIVATDQTALRGLTERIVTAGGQVLEIRAERRDLEEFFIQVVREGHP